MYRWLFGALLLLAVVAGTPYVALVFHHLFGTHTIAAIEADGSPNISTSGPGVSQPDWLAGFPGALVTGSTRWQANRYALDSGLFEFLTHDGAGDVRDFYTRSLRERGFRVEDIGLAPLNAPVAAYLGVAGSLLAERRATGEELSVQIRTPNGLVLRPRLVQIVWRKLGPGQESANAKFRANMRAAMSPQQPAPKGP